jgi:phage virion morphogenesis protein
MRFDIRVDGGRRIEDALRQLSETMNPQMKQQLLRKVGAIYLAYAEERFEKQNSPQRKKWEELKPGTIKKKKSALLGRSHIGVNTGKLASSLTFRVQGDEVFVGTDIIYGRTFHFLVKKGAFGINARGQPIPWGDIPARPFLGRNERADKKVLNMMNQFFSTKIFG